MPTVEALYHCFFALSSCKFDMKFFVYGGFKTRSKLFVPELNFFNKCIIIVI